MKPTLTKEQILAKEIHAAFDEAANATLVAPKEYLIPEKKALEEKAKRLEKLGFTGCKEITQLVNFDKEKEALQKLQEQRRKTHEYAQMYAKKYPDLKFITQDQVNRIGEKYNLVTERVDRYIGDIPEQKLFEIEYWMEEIEENDIPDNQYGYEIHVKDKEWEQSHDEWIKNTLQKSPLLSCMPPSPAL
jgi:hypothetical protein